MKLRDLILILLGISCCFGLVFWGISIFNSKIITPEVENNQNPELILKMVGEEKEELKNPIGIFATNNKIYVTDSDNHRIQVFDPNGKLLFRFGKKGDKHGEFQYPVGIVVDNEGRIYVSEINSQRVQIFSNQGKFVSLFPKDKKALVAPTAMTIDKKGKIYIVDKADQKIKVFTQQGEKVLEFGGRGQGPGLFAFPMGIAIDEYGKIFVSDTGNSRIQVFNAKGEFINAYQGTLQTPRGIALTASGNIIVSDAYQSRIEIMEPWGEPIKYIGQMGIKDEEFYFPDGIAYSNGKLYIADKGNNRVVVYQIDKSAGNKKTK